MVRSTLLPLAGGRQIAQVPKCHISIFHARFRHVFWDYHMIIWTHPSKSHLGKLVQHVRSQWILLGWSRSQNHIWENEERGFQLDEMLDFESHQNQHRNIPGITRDHQGPLGMIPDDPGCTWVMSGNFQNFMIFINFTNFPGGECFTPPLPIP